MPADLNTLYQQAAQGQWADVRDIALPAWRADPHNMRLGLIVGVALIETGQKRDGIFVLSMLSEQNPIIRTAQYNPNVHGVLQDCARRADFEIRTLFTDTQTQTIAEFGAERAGRIKTALWPQTHAGQVGYPDNIYGPKPYIFYAPDLPATPVFDAHNTPWTETLAVATDAITDEYMAATQAEPDIGAPYVDAGFGGGQDWATLKGNRNWNAVHLYKDGIAQPAAVQCPKTLAALETIPLVTQKGLPMEVFFSALKPGVTIPPHFGLANCRVTVHLPIIVPGNGAIRVADHTHIWQRAEPFIFDDSFDHSAWNHHTTDTRIVLIFEAWRPDMTDDEIGAAKASYAARHALIEDRAFRFEAVLEKA